MSIYTQTEYRAMQQDAIDQTLAEALKAAPPVAVTGAAWIGGLTINDLVGVVTLLYLAAQLGLLVPRYYRLFKEWREK